MTTLLAVAAGGLGALARYGIGLAAQRRWIERPIGTAVVNVSGAAALGILLALDPGESVVRVVGMGLLGGFTTFSTWMVETLVLTGPGIRHRTEASVNVAFVLTAGWAAYAVASALG